VTRERVSDRLVDQRVRNRIIETLEDLVAWRALLERQGGAEYFNSFEDWIPERFWTPDGRNSAVDEAEMTALKPVFAAMDALAERTSSPFPTEEEMHAANGAPAIAPLAEAALAVFNRRGRMSETEEEA
jgi:hypothetical protein